MTSTRPALPLVEAKNSSSTTVSYAQPVTRLDRATKLGRYSLGKYRPTVGEHSVQVMREASNPADRKLREPDPERSRKEAQKRAGVVLRRWCVHNRIRRLCTLTFATARDDRDDVLKEIRRFLRGLGAENPNLLWCYVLEVHPGGHGYHVHLGFSHFVSKRTIAHHWGRGFVDIRMLKTKVGQDVRQHARRTAQYLAKYASKAEDEGRAMGRHRYERSQGHNPTEVEIEGAWIDLCTWILGRMKETPWMWDSESSDTWCGPRTLIIRE